MITLSNTLAIFLHAVKRNKISLAGACIVTFVFPVLIVCAILDLLEVFHTPLFGAFVYGALTPLFIFGHFIFFSGFFFVKSGADELAPCSYAFLKQKFDGVTERTSFRNFILFATVLGISNFVILVVVAYTGHHYSETPRFCGTLCHTVMMPEFAVQKISSHSRVSCVECHVGSGMKNFISSKISGIRQVVAIATGDFSRPIKMPTHGLRPANETCEECHRPELFMGDKVTVKDMYEEDETNTHLQTVLLMKLGSGGQRGVAKGIHWHVSSVNSISYTYQDDARDIISEVQLTKPDGTVVVYANTALADIEHKGGHGGVKEMDCVDCHNQPSHKYYSPEEALDYRITDGLISRELPFIKKKGMEFITADYGNKDEAAKAIAAGLTGWYQKNYPVITTEKQELLEQAVASIQESYQHNIYPDMKIFWNTYPSNLGHRDDGGCFRCHNDEFEAKDGSVITQDCESCHILLAEEEEDPSVIQVLKGE